MALRDIKVQVQQYTGLDDNDPNDAALMLQLINAAALEIYNTGDLPGLLDEAVYTLDPTYQVAIPNVAANIRGIREYYSQQRYSLVNPSERYQNNPWYRDWERFRIKTNSPIMRDIANAGVITITTQAADNGVVTIIGSTAGSSRISENVTMDAVTKNSVAQFRTVHSITASVARTYDYIFSDIASNVLAILPNNEYKTNYQVFLLSNYPWAGPNLPTQTMEFQYKRAFVPFVNDGDEFPAVNYDNAIYYKFQANWDALRKGDEVRAGMAEVKSNAVLAGEVRDKTAKEPDSRVIFEPSSGQRLQRKLKYMSLTPYNIFRP